MLSRPGSRRHFDVGPSEGSVLATGDGLNARDAQRLSTALDRALWQGRVEEHLRQLHNAAGAVDRQPCPLCGGTGLRRAQVCFSHEPVEEFAGFLRESGGFQIL